jgi:hypothetical protein
MKKKNEISIKAVRKIEKYLDDHLQFEYNKQKVWKQMDSASRKKFRQDFRRIIEDCIGNACDTLEGETIKAKVAPTFKFPPKVSPYIKRYHHHAFGNFTDELGSYWIEVNAKTNQTAFVYEDGTKAYTAPMPVTIKEYTTSGVWKEF